MHFLSINQLPSNQNVTCKEQYRWFNGLDGEMRKILLILIISSPIAGLFAGSPQLRSPVKLLSARAQLSSDNSAQLAGFNHKSLQPYSSTGDTLRILALRAEFVSDNVATTTGNGRFDLTSESAYIFDPPPHDRTYFQRQLIALSNYFRKVSGGKVNLVADVFPPGENAAYQLSNDMVYYSGQENESLKKQRWAELLRDALEATENTDKPDLQKYDCFIVFHAGVGSDFAFDFDPTPYDIQSVFIDFATLKETLGIDDANYAGIEVEPGVFVKEGIILPETQNQEEQNLALLGTMTLLMGSKLGLPSLFDTNSGRSGIGRWGLMDQGSYNYQGLIPAEPSAWEKVYMGWEEPVVVTSAEGMRIGSSNVKSAPHIIKIPIDSREYLLVENRQRDRNGDGISVGRDEQGKRVEFDSTGKVTVEAGLGVITRIDEYDFGLPGSGILIWHIDERIIEANIAANTINNDREHRGVDLVECDGAQDIGYYYSLLDVAYGTENGDYFDTYWASNESHLTVNNSNQVELSPSSIPNSNANNGAKTHIRLTAFSERDTVMTLSIRSDLALPRFPQYAGKEFGAGALLSFHDGRRAAPVIFAAATDGRILGWKADGSRLIANDETVTLPDLRGNPIVHELALFAATNDSLLLPLTSGDVNGDQYPELIAADAAESLYVFTLADEDGNGWADLLTAASIGSRPSAGPMVVSASGGENRIVIGTQTGVVLTYAWQDGALQVVGQHAFTGETITGLAAYDGVPAATRSIGAINIIASTKNGHIAAMKQDGTIIWENQIPGSGKKLQPLVADFDGNGGFEIAVFSDEGELSLYAGAGTLSSNSSSSDFRGTLSAPSLGDIDGDGLPEVLFAGSEFIAAQEVTGVPTLNFPVNFLSATEAYAAHFSSPIWLSASGKSSALVASSDGMIRLFDKTGADLAGEFPLTTGGAIETTPVLANIDGDEMLELLAVSTDGFLYAWDVNLSSDSNTEPWLQYGGGPSRTFANGILTSSTINTAVLMPDKKVFCYPNPTENNRTNIRYSLTRPASEVSIRFYDLAGDFVQELRSSELSVGDHELIWEVSRIESGVYLARIEARSGSQNQVEFIKIAVVK